MGEKKTKVFTDNISFKYLETKAQTTSKEWRWYHTIILMHVKLIHKLGQNNLMPDMLSREELITLRLLMLVEDKFHEVKKDFVDDV